MKRRILIIVVFLSILSSVMRDGLSEKTVSAENRLSDTQLLGYKIYREIALDKGVFLIANESLWDPNFRKSVVLIVRYDRDGTRGLIINRPTDINISTVFPEIESLKNSGDAIFFGGPVAINQVYGLARSEREIEGSSRIFKNVRMVTSYEILTRVLGEGRQTMAFRAYSGFAGWAPGQLESEIHRGDWRIIQANTGAIFDEDPNLVWSQIMTALTREWI